jgi:hypothetical protein
VLLAIPRPAKIDFHAYLLISLITNSTNMVETIEYISRKVQYGMVNGIES